MSQTKSIDRLPPYSAEAETGVLGCVLLSPNECVPECMERFGNALGDVFYDLRNREVFTAMVEMYDNREAIDVITLQQWLKDKHVLEQVGGIAHLSTLADAVPSASNLSFYTDIVYSKYMLRRIINVCTDVAGRVYDYEGEVNTLMDEVERDILKIGELRTEKKSSSMKDLVKRAINTIEECHQRAGQISGVSTGFPDLDKMTDGFQNGDMIVIAARPSLGKSSIAMNFVEHVALDLKPPVGVFSLEMTDDSLVLRLLCSRARVNLRNVREGFMSERDFPKLTNAANKLLNAPIYIDDSSGLSIIQLRAKARRMHQRYGVKLLVIDYLQLLHSTSRKAQTRQQEVGDISHGIKNLAKELNIPVVVLAQLNREMERDKNRRPRLSDLRESGDVEQDADVVGLLYRPAEEESDTESDGMAVKLIIAKQRCGPTGEISLTFLKPYTRFESVARMADADVPQ